MVSAHEVVRELGIPRSTLYRLVRDGKVPYESARQPWHQRNRLMFRISDVRQALDRLGPEPK